MKNRSWFVTKREYFKVVKSVSFWLATLFFPIFIVVISFVSGYSTASYEKKIEEIAASADDILIYDETGLIAEELIVDPFKQIWDVDEGLNEIKRSKVDALFVYEHDFVNEGIKIYAQDQGLFATGMYNEIALGALKQSIILGLGDPVKVTAMVSEIPVNETLYKDGVISDFGFEKFIIPGLSVVLYFILVSFSTSYLLMSVSEEKENRVIETVLSIIKPKELILGKLLGQIAVVITQLTVLLFLAFIGLKLTESSLPFEIDWNAVDIDFSQILLAIFYTATGFLVLANMMIAVASAVPTYKEAQSFSSVFVIASIMPIYFIMSIVAEPSGILATILSFTPFTAPFILLFRNALGELNNVQMFISLAVMSFYVYLSFFIAFKVFELGSLQFGRKIDFRKIFRS